MRITGFETIDIRFPTSQNLDGSDAMNPDPDYSAAYVILKTESNDLSGFGMTHLKRLEGKFRSFELYRIQCITGLNNSSKLAGGRFDIDYFSLAVSRIISYSVDGLRKRCLNENKGQEKTKGCPEGNGVWLLHTGCNG